MAIEYLNNSKLTWLKQALRGNTFDQSESYLIFGDLVDAMLTEPAKVDHIDRSFVYNGNVVKFNKIIFQTAKNMTESCLDYMDKMNMTTLFEKSYKQHVVCREKVEIVVDDEISFLMNMKCKYDIHIPNIIGIDFKTTQAKTWKQFYDACKWMEYDRSRYFYSNVSGTKNDWIVGISKHPPHRIFHVDSNFKYYNDDTFLNSGKECFLNIIAKWYCLFGSNVKEDE
jgi:hypothetical protein